MIVEVPFPEEAPKTVRVPVMAVIVYVEPLRVAVSVPLAEIEPPEVMGSVYWKLNVLCAKHGLIANAKRITNLIVTMR